MNTKQSIRRYVAFGLVASATMLAITAVSARDQVPFSGVASGSVISVTPLDECNQLAEAVNGGNASHIGALSGPQNLS